MKLNDKFEKNTLRRGGVKGLMKIKNHFFLLCVSLVMCFCANTAFAEDNEILKIFDFEKN
ncbi:MAG: hypothetical protein L6V93_14915 [Clostridiales bacterium]|nr:MAG: hypothetical protein L6V93_14915 [Clostridiales bacterium]